MYVLMHLSRSNSGSSVGYLYSTAVLSNKLQSHNHIELAGVGIIADGRKRMSAKRERTG